MLLRLWLLEPFASQLFVRSLPQHTRSLRPIPEIPRHEAVGCRDPNVHREAARVGREQGGVAHAREDNAARALRGRLKHNRPQCSVHLLHDLFP